MLKNHFEKLLPGIFLQYKKGSLPTGEIATIETILSPVFVRYPEFVKNQFLPLCGTLNLLWLNQALRLSTSQCVRWRALLILVPWTFSWRETPIFSCLVVSMKEIGRVRIVSSPVEISSSRREEEWGGPRPQGFLLVASILLTTSKKKKATDLFGE